MGEKDEAKKSDDGGSKKGDGPTTVVLKLDLHCEGCAKKVKRVVRHFDGVVDVKADATSNKLTVTGSVDPTKLRERVAEKTGKKVELLSSQLPPAKKEDGGKGGDNKNAEEKPTERKPVEKKLEKETKKAEPKPVSMSTVVLKIRLHCDGCTQKIKRVIKKTKGVDSIEVDEAKDLITVKGSVDAKEFVPYLRNKLKRNVEAITPKKEEGGGDKKEKEVKKDDGGGEKKDKQGGGEKKEKESGGGGEKKAQDTGVDKKKEGGNEKKENGGKEKKEGGGGQSKGASTSGDDSQKSDEKKSEVNKSDYYGYPQHSYYSVPMQNHGYTDEGYNMPHNYNQGFNYDHGYSNQGYTTQIYANQSYTTPSYTQTYPNHGQVIDYSHHPPSMYYHAPPQGDYLHAPPTPAYVHAPQMFSDENPNACFVM